MLLCILAPHIYAKSISYEQLVDLAMQNSLELEFSLNLFGATWWFLDSVLGKAVTVSVKDSQTYEVLTNFIQQNDKRMLGYKTLYKIFFVKVAQWIDDSILHYKN